jgi:type I restriction enzyme M protein
MDINKIDVMWDDSPIDVTNEVNFIWSIANKLRGPYQSDKYKDVIIPMTIIRRFECALEETKQDVVNKFEANPTYPAKAMYRISGYQFYNTSKFSLAELVNDADHLASNFKSYINGFSANIQDIIKNLEFDKQIEKMDKHNRLLSVVKAFSELDLNPKTVDNMKMGYIFEELIRKFSENAEAGDHYTGRDIIKVMVSIILAEGCDDIFDDGKVITILDQAAGTGGMLSTANNYIKRFNPSADVRMFSQEVNPESYAMCLAEMLIRGQNAENIKLQDTMKADCFPDTKMRFILENPPFGQPWAGKDAPEGDEEAVNNEALKGSNGRFPAGKPGGGDMQLLFIQSALNKLDEKNGRACIIENGSPLFSGGTSSGESQIRRWLLENDYIEAIIQLNTEMFYNTGIATYIWVLSKNKRIERKGKIQLIDASSFCHKLRKSLGNKRNEITPEDRAMITKLYSNFEENEYCQIHNNTEFMYREYSIMQPLQRNYAITRERIDTMLSNGALSTLYDEAKVNELENMDELTSKDKAKLDNYQKNKPIYDSIVEALNNNISNNVYKNPESFTPIIEKLLSNVMEDSKELKKNIDKVVKGLSVMDKTANIQKDKKGNILYDTDTKDVEIVPYDVSIDDYMAKEVLPHIPDAKYFFEEDLSKKTPTIKTGAEIPFTRYFYKYEAPTSSDELEKELMELDSLGNSQLKEIFGGN